MIKLQVCEVFDMSMLLDAGHMHNCDFFGVYSFGRAFLIPYYPY